MRTIADPLEFCLLTIAILIIPYPRAIVLLNSSSSNALFPSSSKRLLFLPPPVTFLDLVLLVFNTLVGTTRLKKGVIVRTPYFLFKILYNIGIRTKDFIHVIHD